MKASLLMVWRTLRSMRTALILLLFLAGGAIIGSVIPQEQNSPQRVASYFRDHPFWAALWDRLGFFHTYGSIWFTLIYTLLLISLVACLAPRTRALFRHALERPEPVRELESMRHYAQMTVSAEPFRAIAESRKVLRRRMYRVSAVNGDARISADKGLAREAGSLLFHWSFLLVLVGIVYGKGTGFTGQAVIIEGQTWVEAHANYDGTVNEGAFFNEDHSGIAVHVQNFTVDYYADGVPKLFDTKATLTDANGDSTRTSDIEVNHPAEMDGVKFYQFGYGWAPMIDISRNGRALAAGPVVCTQSPPPAGVAPLAMPSNCVVKVASVHPQLGFRFELWPDSRVLIALLRGGQSTPMLRAYQPVLTFAAYRGSLGLSAPQSVGTLDTSLMSRWKTGAVGAGKTQILGDGISVSFPQLKQYTVLEVTRDRGQVIMLIAAILILAGLIPALFTSKRRVYVSAEANGKGTILRVGGFALQRKSQFEEEFPDLVRTLVRSADRKVGAS